MAEQEEKRIIVKVAYNYFQNGRWERALEEYRKLVAIDPMDFLVHNMIAEIHIRKGEQTEAIASFLKAASLLRATNNLEKAAHAYRHILRLEPKNEEAREKIEEIVRARLVEVDDYVRRGSLKNAATLCERLLDKLPDHVSLQQKMDELELRMKDTPETSAGTAEPPARTTPPASEPLLPKRDDGIQRDDVIKNLYAMASRYEEKESWDEAVEAYITILRFQPDDDTARVKLRDLYRKITRQDKAAEVWARITAEKQKRIDQAKKIAESKAREEARKTTASRAGLGEAVEEMEKLREQAEKRLRRAVEDRRERDKTQADSAAEEAPVSEEESSTRALLTQAQMYIHQNLLVEAMRICQRVLEIDPQNKEVRGLLKQIYDKKNL